MHRRMHPFNGECIPQVVSRCKNCPAVQKITHKVTHTHVVGGRYEYLPSKKNILNSTIFFSKKDARLACASLS